jgi:hypothetical protein
MNPRRQAVERRRADRPANGESAICPRCRLAQVEFNERYRLPAGDDTLIITPAWVCESPKCGYHRPVREEDRPNPSDRHEKLAALRAKASRRVMKSRAVRERADRSLKKSLARKR